MKHEAGAHTLQRFTDKASVGGIRKTDEGYLVADAFTVRTGIQTYAGFEVGRPDLIAVKVYRPGEQVFAKDSVQSFVHVPVTNDHPNGFVDAENWRDLAVGEVSTDVLRDGERLKLSLIVKDASAISQVYSGKRELSAGYTCDLVWDAGETADGEAYDAVQTNIRANHVAIVGRGRAGPEFRIGDSQSAETWGAAPMTDEKVPPMNLPIRNIVFDGISIQVTDQGAQAIEKLQGRVGELTADNVKMVADHNAAIAKKDEEIGTLKADLQKAKDASNVDVDKLVADRSALVDTARKIFKDVKVDGVKDADIRKAVVTHALGEETVKDSSDAEIAGMFKALAKDAKSDNTGDPVRQALQNRDSKQQVDAQTEYENRIRDAWKPAA